MPKISIIIPIYNADSYLKECLNSVRSQEFADFECICILSGASEKTNKIIESFSSDNRFKIINTKIEGVAKARNTGLLNANGEWFAFLDANDFISCDYLKNMYENALKTNADVIANTNITKYYSKHRKFQRSIKSKNGVYEITPSVVYNTFGRSVIWNKLYNMKAFKETGISFPDGNDFEDEFFYYCLLPHLNTISIINKPSYFFRVRKIPKYPELKIAETVDKHHQILDVFMLIKEYYIKKGFINNFTLPFSLLKSQFKHFANKKLMLDLIYNAIDDLEIDYTKLSKKDARFVKDIKDKKFIKLWLKSWF